MSRGSTLWSSTAGVLLGCFLFEVMKRLRNKKKRCTGTVCSPRCLFTGTVCPGSPRCLFTGTVEKGTLNQLAREERLTAETEKNAWLSETGVDTKRSFSFTPLMDSEEGAGCVGEPGRLDTVVGNVVNCRDGVPPKTL